MGTVKLTILSDQLRGTTFELTEEQYTVGRTEATNICIPDGTISSHHALIFKDAEQNAYCLRDEGSTNGTRVNGKKLEDQAVILNNGDLVQFGSVELMFDSGEASNEEIPRASSVINLDDTGTIKLSNTAAFKSKTGVAQVKRSVVLRDNKKLHRIFMICVGVLLVFIILGCGWFIRQLLMNYNQ